MTRTASDIIASTPLERPPSMTGTPIQKLRWHIQGLENDLEGANALMAAFPSLTERAQSYVLTLLQRGMR
jgi:hypothetical protein